MTARAVAAALALVAAPACIDPIDPRWTLDHDHVVAVRATPPRIAAGERALLDALVARRGEPAAVAAPLAAAGPLAPAPLAAAIGFDGAAWTVTAPDEAALAAARTALALPAGAPVPLDVVMSFSRPAGDPLPVKKTVWLGAHADNPAMPALTVDGAPAGDSLAIPIATDVYVSIATDARVNWLTSCGALFQDDVATAFVRADEADAGELAVVVRDASGGVAWQVWPLVAR